MEKKFVIKNLFDSTYFSGACGGLLAFDGIEDAESFFTEEEALSKLSHITYGMYSIEVVYVC